MVSSDLPEATTSGEMEILPPVGGRLLPKSP
jgi:hypothetical protein